MVMLTGQPHHHSSSFIPTDSSNFSPCLQATTLTQQLRSTTSGNSTLRHPPFGARSNTCIHPGISARRSCIGCFVPHPNHVCVSAFHTPTVTSTKLLILSTHAAYADSTAAFTAPPGQSYRRSKEKESITHRTHAAQHNNTRAATTTRLLSQG